MKMRKIGLMTQKGLYSYTILYSSSSTCAHVSQPRAFLHESCTQFGPNNHVKKNDSSNALHDILSKEKKDIAPR